jgi:hypothetical protein
MTHRYRTIATLLFVIALLGGLGLSAVYAQDDDGAAFTVNETTFESHYPRGMTYTIKAESDAGPITRATLFYVLRPGTRERANAEYDMAQEAWVAHAYETGGLPPWIDFNYYWLLTDSEGNTFETEPQYAIYEDNTREWQHVDTDEITLHYFGFSEDGAFGDMVAEAMEAMHEQFAEGWGRNLSFKPIVIFFPSGNVWDEFQTGGSNSRAAGFTNNGWGYSLQRLADEQPPEFLMECVERWGYSTERPLELRLERGVATIVHELTHIHQSDFRVGGPAWWTEGQADFFASLTGLDSNPDTRLTNLLTVTNDLPTLQGSGPSLAVGAMAPDSCNGLGYDMGNDFMQWLLGTYGGLELHQRIVEEMQTRDGLEVALERTTGRTFLQLENEWRATWNLPPVDVLPTATPFALPTAPVITIPTAPGSGG